MKKIVLILVLFLVLAGCNQSREQANPKDQLPILPSRVEQKQGDQRVVEVKDWYFVSVFTGKYLELKSDMILTPELQEELNATKCKDGQVAICHCPYSLTYAAAMRKLSKGELDHIKKERKADRRIVDGVEIVEDEETDEEEEL